MSTFVKVDRFYVNLDSIALVEDAGEAFVVRLTNPTANGPQVLNVKKTSNEGMDLLKALGERLPR